MIFRFTQYHMSLLTLDLARELLILQSLICSLPRNRSRFEENPNCTEIRKPAQNNDISFYSISYEPANSRPRTRVINFTILNLLSTTKSLEICKKNQPHFK